MASVPTGTPSLARRLRRLARWVGAVGALGCQTPSARSSPASPLEGVEVAGCAAFRAGPACDVGTSRELRVFVRDDARAVSIASDVGRASVVAEEGEYRVSVPPGATRLVVRAEQKGEARRFELVVSDAQPAPAWLTEAREDRARGALDEAERALDARATDGGADADAASLRARIALSRGDVDGAMGQLATAAAMHAARGEISAAVNDEAARAQLALRDALRVADARDALGHVRALSVGYAEGGALATCITGQLAWAGDDAHDALARLDEARRRAEQIGYAQLAHDAASWYAIALSDIGRVEEARAAVDHLEERAWASMTACERANLRANQGWFALLARDAPSSPREPSVDPKPALREAAATFGVDCVDPQRRANALVNVSWALLQEGDVSGARATLADARAVAPNLEPFVALFALDLDGRIALNAGAARAALAAYADLAVRAAGVSRLDEARAAEGESDARARMGDRAGALAAIERADAMLDEAARGVRLGEGRGAFWWGRARIAKRRVGLLIDAGRADDALDVVREVRARIAADVRRVAGTKPLDPEARARWESALAEYRRGRDALARSAEADWSLPRDALARAVASRRVADDQLRDRLDLVARAVFPPPARPDAPLASEDGTLALVWYPLDDAWSAFQVERGRVRARRIVAPLDGAHAREAASLLLASAADAVRRARRVRVLAFDALRDVDVHALPFPAGAAAPLLAQATVEYALDAAQAESTDPPGAPLVVADPTGTLPAARREGQSIAAALAPGSGATLLVGDDATRARVLAALPAASALYYSGHASYAGVDGWDSALFAANDQRIAIADLVSLSRAPALVVLAGCETGREGEREGAIGLGLAEAFVGAGARAVVASPRTVRDDDSEALVRAFVAALAQSPDDPGAALRRAELDRRRAAPAADWGAFRVFTR